MHELYFWRSLFSAETDLQENPAMTTSTSGTFSRLPLTTLSALPSPRPTSITSAKTCLQLGKLSRIHCCFLGSNSHEKTCSVFTSTRRCFVRALARRSITTTGLSVPEHSVP